MQSYLSPETASYPVMALKSSKVRSHSGSQPMPIRMLRSDQSNFIGKSIAKSFDDHFDFLDKSVVNTLRAITKVIRQLH